MKIDQPTTLAAGEFAFQLSPGWTHFGNETRLVLQKPEVEVVGTLLTGWAETDTRLRSAATKAAIRSAEDAAKVEELEPPVVDGSSKKTLWSSVSRAKDGGFFGQFVLTGTSAVLYLTCESLAEPKIAETLFGRLLEAAKAGQAFSL